MSVIKISAAELAPGDDDNGEIVATVEVQGARTYLTYQGDDTRIRVRSADVYAVEREGGVSTAEDERVATRRLTTADILAIEAEIGDQRERELQRDLRRSR
jgi:hypothetical protein